MKEWQKLEDVTLGSRGHAQPHSAGEAAVVCAKLQMSSGLMRSNEELFDQEPGQVTSGERVRITAEQYLSLPG